MILLNDFKRQWEHTSAAILEAVASVGESGWYVLGKNEGHGFAKKPNLDYLQAVETLFLRRFLLGEDGGTPP